MSYQMVETERVIASATNPRRHVDSNAEYELAESVRKHGILQPVLVRRISQDGKGDWRVIKGVTLPGERDGYSVGRGQAPDAVILRESGLTKAQAQKRADELNGATFELVAGERRWRAARAAGLVQLPAIVRDLTDQEALEIQVVENLQRADLHPMEEAAGYERLTRDYNYTVEDLAAKVGKSKPYVYGRLKLLNLVPKVRAAFEKGELTPSVALLVARVPSELQEEVLDECCLDYDGNPAPLRDVRTELERSYMLRLSEAPWSLKDTELVPQAGGCATCPKRTGNQPDLFADVKAKDTCTDPICFKAKRVAWNERTLREAKAKGQELKPSDAVFDQYGHIKKGFVKLSDRCEPLGWDSAKTWARALTGVKVDPVVTTTKDGEVVAVLPADEAMMALKETGVKIKADDGGDRYEKSEEKRRKNKQVNTRIAMAATPYILVGSAKDIDGYWRLLAKAAYDVTSIDVHEFVAKRRGLAKKMTEARAALDKWFRDEHTTDGYREMVVELLLCARWGGDWAHSFRKDYLEACELAGVRVQRIGDELQKLDKAKESAKPEPKAGGKGSKLSAAVRGRRVSTQRERRGKQQAHGARRFADPAEPKVVAGEEEA